jgi:hypothetical protein
MSKKHAIDQDNTKLNYMNLEVNIFQKNGETTASCSNGRDLRSSSSRVSTLKPPFPEIKTAVSTTSFKMSAELEMEKSPVSESLRRRSKSKKKGIINLQTGIHRDSILTKSYLSDNDNQASMIYEKHKEGGVGGYDDPDELNLTSLNTTKRLITKEVPEGNTGFEVLNIQKPRKLVSRNSSDFSRLQSIEMETPDQVKVNEIYINFKFLEFVTAFYTVLST